MEDIFKKIYKMQHELNILVGRDTINDPEKQKWLFDYTFAASSECQELMDCCNWKFWSDEGHTDQYQKILNLKNSKIEAIDILHFLISIFQILDMTPDDIFKIYKMKHEKNILRQKNGYSILNKTNGDNEEIEKSL